MVVSTDEAAQLADHLRDVDELIGLDRDDVLEADGASLDVRGDLCVELRRIPVLIQVVGMSVAVAEPFGGHVWRARAVDFNEVPRKVVQPVSGRPRVRGHPSEMPEGHEHGARRAIGQSLQNDIAGATQLGTPLGARDFQAIEEALEDVILVERRQP